MWRNDLYSGTFDIVKQIDLSSATILNSCFNLSGIKNINFIAPKQSFTALNFIAHTANTLYSAEEVVADDMSYCTSIGALSGRAITKLKLPNVKVSYGLVNGNLSAAELKRIIENDLSPDAQSQTFTITGNPGTAEVMAAITAGTIVVPTGWTIAN